MKTNPPTPALGLSWLALGILMMLLTIVVTIVLIEPSSGQTQVTSDEAVDYVGYLGTVCGRVTGVDQDSKAINALLLFGNPEHPSFTASIFPRRTGLERKYDGKQVCVMGKIVDESEPNGFPSIRVTDQSQISIK
jgi:hypothetical protein